MRLVLISDTHKQHAQLKLPDGDVLIHAGDFLGWGTALELIEFKEWFQKAARKFEKVVLVAGNHDRILEQQPREAQDVLLDAVPNLFYLQDSGCAINGVKFWGSPWTTEFQNWAFMKRPGFDMDKAWEIVPEDTQVLVTHSPARGILDRGFGTTRIGCEMLAHRLGPEGNLKPALHVHGHSHFSYGQQEENGILRVNAALANDRNLLVNQPVVLEGVV